MQPLLSFDLDNAKPAPFIAQIGPCILHALAKAINNISRFLPIDRGEVRVKADMRYIDPSLLSCL
ncbi:MAG: hypothetical protein A2Z08_09925 [Deltaproteobacteria bacterium RBG_16_54_11]|jgi:hypothetical protein|nr:MAG: hypothetical protein A2Z08_09925 [Deltaproteobacteria bacterium RBG_16_54_11]